MSLKKMKNYNTVKSLLIFPKRNHFKNKREREGGRGRERGREGEGEEGREGGGERERERHTPLSFLIKKQLL